MSHRSVANSSENGLHVLCIVYDVGRVVGGKPRGGVPVVFRRDVLIRPTTRCFEIRREEVTYDFIYSENDVCRKEMVRVFENTITVVELTRSVRTPNAFWFLSRRISRCCLAYASNTVVYAAQTLGEHDGHIFRFSILTPSDKT